ncbi:MAG TPA: serine hydrolase domain-containing protein [Acidimicrobiia bacterium]|nr:serine hydrolase domain-containing protein [Acidimicrobiia bacterium]
MDFEQLESYLVDRAARDLFSGAVRLSRDGTSLFEGAYGQASRAWGIPNSVDTRFDTASITKLFTAVVALQAVEEGLLSLDTKAVSYLGLEGTSIHPDAELRHLLTHTSGIGDDADEEAGEDYAEVWRHHTSYLVREVEDMLPLFVDRPGNFTPGEGCRYCNVAFDLAGLMVERATGEPYRERVQREVFDRAGMADSGFFSMDIVEPRVAEGADLVDGRWVRNIYSYMPIGTPSGGAHSTVADLERFLTVVQEGGLLGPETTAMFLTPQARHSERDGETLHMGFGLEFTFDPEGALLHYEKEGINAGTSAVLRHYPSTGTTLTILSNMEDGVWEPREQIDSLLRDRS